METKRTHIVISGHLVAQIDRIVGKRGRSKFFTPRLILGASSSGPRFSLLTSSIPCPILILIGELGESPTKVYPGIVKGELERAKGD